MAMEQVSLQELQRLNDAINFTFEAIRRVAPQLAVLQQMAQGQNQLGGFGMGFGQQLPWHQMQYGSPFGQQLPWQQMQYGSAFGQQLPWHQQYGAGFGVSPWSQQVSPFGPLGQVGMGGYGLGGIGQYGIPQYPIAQQRPF
jgi:hypothetical protein